MSLALSLAQSAFNEDEIPVGAIIVHKGKVIGVICFGSAVSRFYGTRRLVICPIHCSSAGRIQQFIKAYSA